MAPVSRNSLAASSSAVKAQKLHNENPAFTPFPRLPVEIRDQIWTLSLPPPRLIPLQTEGGALLLPVQPQDRPTFNHVWATTTVPVPSLLHTTQHSRLVAFRHYTLSFDHNPRPPKHAFTACFDGLKPLRRSQRHSLESQSPEAIFEAFEFPFGEKALVYVDLRRDVFITSHRWLHRRKDPPDDAGCELMPISSASFKLATFRQVIPRSVFEKIHTLVCTFSLGMHELFPGRYGSGMGTSAPVFVIQDPFLREGQGEGEGDVERYGENCGRDFINSFKGSWKGVNEEYRATLGKRIVGPMRRSDFNAAFERGDFFVGV